MPKQRTIRLLACVTVAALLSLAGPATAARADTDIEPPHILPVFGATLGVPVDVAVRPNSSGETPVGYQYQFAATLSTGPVLTVDASTGTGTATITVTPLRHTEILTIRSIAADGTLSAANFFDIVSNAAMPYLDKDANGDGVADLFAVGGTPGVSSGFWQALGVGAPNGTPNGRLLTPATNIGINGDSGHGPEQFDGAQVITGQFTGDGFPDLLVYFPSGSWAGSAAVVPGTGDGSVFVGDDFREVVALSSPDLADVNGDSPIEFANAYRHFVDPSSPFFPDLLAISGDSAAGFHLMYYVVPSGVRLLWVPVQVPVATPDGTGDWENWRIATAPVSSGTAMFLWKQSTGELYLWEGVTVSVTVNDDQSLSSSIAYTQYEISPDWNQGIPLSTVEATDFFGDGVPDLWTVDDNGIATAWQVSHLSATRTARIDQLYRHQLIG